MSKFKFYTKAETLDHLYGNIINAMVLPQICFTVGQWQEAKNTLSFITDIPHWMNDKVIVRSSALAEDANSQSMAGHFVSVVNVKGEAEILRAVTKVVASFSDDNADNQVFAQPMLDSVMVSGVAFTRDPNNGAHYFVINYDDKTGSTDTVTDGATNDLTTFYYAKVNSCSKQHNGWLEKLLALLKELEVLFDNDSLDIEFAVTSDGQMVLLQVRPLVFNAESILPVKELQYNIDLAKERFSSLACPHPYLYGKRSVFGVMPDWNPAEIIGIRPRPLALSLYKELVTDNIWAYQRDNYGYRNLRSFPLLINFAGRPYIDVRVSFNSFIPSDIKGELAEKLVNHYTNQLVKNPDLHDKVEFEIIYSCYTLDLPHKLQKLKTYGFDQTECDVFSKSLRTLTNRIIHGDNGLWQKDIAKLNELEVRQERIVRSDLNSIEKIYWLIEDCKRYGTLPFAGLARAGFIAVQLLRSLVAVEVITANEYDLFMGSLKTVSSLMSHDLIKLDKDDFLTKYGHLRPGTYDVLSSRYDETPDQYFHWDKNNGVKIDTEQPSFSLRLESLSKLEELLRDHGLDHDVLSFFEFIKGAIEGREYAKFVFSRSLSEAISLFTALGKDHGFSKEKLSFVDIGIIEKLYSSSESPASLLLESIEKGIMSYEVSKGINLPPLITKADDFYSYFISVNQPNFITQKDVTAEVVNIHTNKGNLPGAILVIPSADPGYDWIFSHAIGGFITMYGGVNSHMAIRAAELGIPAVIGAGEALYCRWEKAQMLEIDCANQQVKILR